ncbi:NADP-dependent oxidoreductase [Streptomyces sp. NPDC057137]|uniref:NADP-dependent oxidoreductase n=1 Tax=Streptomyces sp. NPDC057137 TaxID=3346030 RepID=UPI0036414EE0
MPFPSREWHLTTRPTGEPKPADFTLVSTTVPDPAPGQVVVRNDMLSVDPYMRGRMNDRKSYIPPFDLGEAMDGAAVGLVVASGADDIPVGTAVSHFAGWREYSLVGAAEVEVIDTDTAPASAYLGVLGATGITAYAGLTEIAPVKRGDVVFISGAAGAVGTVAGVVARHLGAAKVIGSAGGPAKARRLVEEFGFDIGLDYREGDLPGQLTTAAPDGIDVYFDNVGGDHLEAALGAINPYGHIALCGAISVYNDTEPSPGPNNLVLAIGKRLSLRGMNVNDHEHLVADYRQHAVGWLEDGSLRTEQTVVVGIDNAVEGFLAMMRGAHTGKTLIELTSS